MRIRGQLLGNLLAGLSASAALAAPARADNGDAALWLSLPSCATPPYEQAELKHALDVELGARGLTGKAGSFDGPRVMLSLSSCEPDADTITLQISTQQGRALADRSVELRSIPPGARARTVALLIVDALEPPRLPGTDEPKAAAPEPPPTSDVPASPRAAAGPLDELLLERKDPYPSSLGLRFGAAAHAQLILRDSNALFGFALSMGGPVSKHSDWLLEGAYARGFTYTPAREYHLQWYDASLGVNLVASERPRLSLGPRLGVASVIGNSVDELGRDTLDRALQLTLGGRAEVSAPVGQFLSLQLALEASDHLFQRSFTAEAELLPMYGLILSWGIGVTLTL